MAANIARGIGGGKSRGNEQKILYFPRGEPYAVGVTSLSFSASYYFFYGYLRGGGLVARS